MLMPKGTEKDRFLFILGQAKYDMNDGVSIPGAPPRTFSTTEYQYINGICNYIQKMIEYYDKKGLLVKEEYQVEQ